MRIKNRRHSILIPALVLGMAAMALAQGGNRRMGILAPLKAALEAAGAPELTSDQESSMLILVDTFRMTYQIPFDDADIRSAREEYETAILNSDLETAGARARSIAKTRATEMAQRETGAAEFAISAIAILKENSGQYTALTDKIGSSGLVRLIVGLVDGNRGGGPGPGPRPGGPPDMLRKPSF